MSHAHRPTAAIAAVLLLLLAAPVRVHAAEAPAIDSLRAFPSTPGGRLAAAWFKAYSGDETGMRRFFEGPGASKAAPPTDARIERWRGMREMTGPLLPVRVLAERPGAIEMLARGRSEWLRIELQFEPEPPHGFRGIGIDQADGTEQPRASSPLSEAQASDSLAALLEREAAAGRFSGAVRLERAGRVLLERAYGPADRATGRANTVATRFNLGSLDKVFTQAAIARLAEAGQLSLDDTLARHLPDYPPDKARRITIRHLLDMRSGIGDFFGERYDAADKSRLRELRDWLPLFADRPLEFEPGAGRRYSNGGYLVLGLVIERLTGRPYRDAVRELVLTPAGMTHTAQLGREDWDDSVARGATANGEGARLEPNDGSLPWRGTSAGGGYSTVDDLARFALALREGRLLRGAPAREVLRLEPRGDGTFALQLGAAGGSPGVNTALEAEDDWTLVVLANLDPPSAERIARRAREWLARLTE